MQLLLRFEDLRTQGLVQTWTTLNRWIDELGFPSGRLIGRNRVWTEAEVLAWIESQPTGKAKLRGRAKKLAAPPENVKPGPSVGAEGTGLGLTNSLSTSRNIGSDPKSQEAA